VYIVFPEGTRTRTGAMSTFKPGIGMLVAATAVPVVPCRLIGTYEALSCNRRWPRPTKVRLVIGEPMVFDRMSDNRQGWDQVAGMIEAAVVGLHG
jgi:1-acyl-sn-glycerol-3-phosphate acyltransferase